MEFLNDAGLLIEQPDNLYKLSSDAVALADFATCKNTDRVIDVGCGTGVLTLLLAYNHRPVEMISVDINADAVQQLEKNLAINQDKLTATHFTTLHTDARTLHTLIPANSADVIICNPPYFTTGKKAQNINVSQARHADNLSLEDLALLCTRNLKYGGTVYFCYPSNQLAKAVTIFENNNFRIKTIKLISNNKGVYLALFRAKKGGGHNTTLLV